MRDNRPIFRLEKIRKKFGGLVAVADVDLNLEERQIIGLIGPNGAGKSTLAFTIMGLSGYRDFEGDILLNGRSINSLNVDERARQGISLAWQEPARFEGLSIRNFLRASARDKSEESIAEALEKVALEPAEYLSRAVDKTLSGGERKRIELASLLVMQPSVVLLDEPDSGIDVEALNRIFEAIQLLKNSGSTVILITHSLPVLQQAEHAFLMCHGSILNKGTVDQICGYFENKCMSCDHKNMPDVGDQS